MIWRRQLYTGQLLYDYFTNRIKRLLENDRKRETAKIISLSLCLTCLKSILESLSLIRVVPGRNILDLSVPV